MAGRVPAARYEVVNEHACGPPKRLSHRCHRSVSFVGNGSSSQACQGHSSASPCYCLTTRQERWYAVTFATPPFVQHETVFQDRLRRFVVEDLLRRPEVVHIALGCVWATERATDYIVGALASTLARWRLSFFCLSTCMCRQPLLLVVSRRGV